MGYGINVVSIVGNLTRDPELKQAGDTSVVNLGVAVNGSVKQSGEWVDRADFFDVTVFGKRAESCAEHLSKGSQIAVSGRLRQDRWQTDGGDTRSRVKIIADQLKFVGSKQDSGSQAEPEDAGPPPDDDDNIPF